MRRSALTFASKRHRRLPHGYDSLPSSTAKEGSHRRRSWNKIGAMTPEERNQVVSGAWRNEPVVKLQLDPTARDGFAADQAMVAPQGVKHNVANTAVGMNWATGVRETSRRTEVAAASDPQVARSLAFQSEEAAEEFLQRAAEEDAAERRVPIAQLATAFFEDLARNADEELDGDGVVEQKTDEERQDEARHVQRQFFADYYIAQGVINEADRYHFLDTMVSAPTSWYVLDANVLLARFVLRQQIEAHIANEKQFLKPVEWFEGAFCVTNAASQPLDMPRRLLPSQKAARLEAQEIIEVLSDAGSIDHTERILSGENVRQDEGDVQLSCERLSMSEGIDVVRSGPSPQPPQPEQLATEPLTADMLSAIMNDDDGHNGDDDLVRCSPSISADKLFDSLSDDRAETDTDLRNVLQAADGDDQEPNSGDALQSDEKEPIDESGVVALGQLHWLQRVVSNGSLVDVDLLGILLPIFAYATRRPHFAGVADRHCIVEVRNNGESSGSGNSNGGSYGRDVNNALRHMRGPHYLNPNISGEFTHTLLSLHRPPLPGREGETSIKQRIGVAEIFITPEESRELCTVHYALPHRSAVLPPEVAARVAVVLCTPRNTCDGVRPRVLLTSDEKAEGRCPANRSMSIIQSSAKTFGRCKGELTYSLTLLPPAQEAKSATESSRDHSSNPAIVTSRVVYALSSMNPIECEAVVACVLTELNDFNTKHGKPARFRPVPIREALCFDAVPNVEQQVFGTLCNGWGNGLQTWSTIDGASDSTDPLYSTESLRATIAQCSWRFRPAQDMSNGGYLCVIERYDVQLVTPQSADQLCNHQEERGAADIEGRHIVVDSSAELGGSWDTSIGLLTMASRETVAVSRLLAASSDKGRVLLCGHPIALSPRSQQGSVKFFPSITATEEACALTSLPPFQQGGEKQLQRCSLSLRLALVLLYHEPTCPRRLLIELVLALSRRSEQSALCHEMESLIERVDAIASQCFNGQGDGTASSLFFSLDASDDEVMSQRGALHQSVHHEIQHTIIVAQLCAKRTKSSIDWQLEWAPVEAADAIHIAVKREALERLVAVRDSVAYCLRSLGLPWLKHDVMNDIYGGNVISGETGDIALSDDEFDISTAAESSLNDAVGNAVPSYASEISTKGTEEIGVSRSKWKLTKESQKKPFNDEMLLRDDVGRKAGFRRLLRERRSERKGAAEYAHDRRLGSLRAAMKRNALDADNIDRTFRSEVRSDE